MMAPRVDRPVARVSPSGGARRLDPQGSGPETERDLTRNTETIWTSASAILCHSSRVKVQPPVGDDRVVEAMADRGGRLAQLVRALP